MLFHKLSPALIAVTNILVQVHGIFDQIRRFFDYGGSLAGKHVR